MRFLGILLSLSAAWGGEFAVFASGSRMRVDSHEMVDATTVRLYTGSGFTELNRSQILEFQAEEAIPAAKPAVAPQTPGAVVNPDASVPLTAGQLADQAADKYGLPRQLLRAVMAAESGFEARAVSAKGAIGLMQLMPSTALELGADARDPAQNVDAGARYLRDLLVKYGGALWHALAAYNAGPGAVEKYGSIPPYRETIRYINRIDRDLRTSGVPNP